MSLDHYLTTEPEDRQDALTPEEPDFDVVYVTCKECRHQIEAGEDCPYCEKSADTGRLGWGVWGTAQNVRDIRKIDALLKGAK